MDINFLKNLINENMSTYDISHMTKKSQSAVRYWLKKYDIKSNHKSFKDLGKKDYGDSRICPKCKMKKNIDEFYQRRGKPNSSVYCKSCTTTQTVDRMREFKRKCVEYKGGECIYCKYSKCTSALEFHHLDPNSKDFSISHRKAYSFSDEIKFELDKCILVCANCHREIHSGLLVAPLGIEPRMTV